MAQVQNLLDLFQKGLPDGQAAGDANAAPKPKGAARARSGAKSAQGSLLPVSPGPSDKTDREASASRSSFQAKVEKSKAKLAAKERGRGDRDLSARHASSRPERAPQAPADANGPRTEAPRSRSAGSADADRPEARTQPRPERAERRAPESEDAAVKPVPAPAPDPSGTESGPSVDQALDERSRDAIKEGLESLGIEVDDRQLEDPAFLMEILRLLQAMPVRALPDDASRGEAQTVQFPQVRTIEDSGAGIESFVPAEGPEEPAAEEEAQNGTAKVPDGSRAPVSRKELARLLEGRIAGLERAQGEPGHDAQADARTRPASPIGEWQPVSTHARAESPIHEEMPLADLDRLRVMQASAMQTAPAPETAGMHTDLVLESDSVEPASESAPAGQADAGKEVSAGRDQGAQTDLFDRNGERPAGAEAIRKDGPQAPKEGASGPQFHAALDHARASAHRTGHADDPVPRAIPHEAAVLEQIARKLTSSARRHGDEISIQLAPEHLGKVRVSLEMKEGAMNARIAVENDAVRKQVESNLAALKDALKDQGIQLQGMEVSVDQRHGSLFNPDGSNAESFFRHRGGRGGEEGRAQPELAPFESAAEPDTGRRWGYNTLEFIG